MLFRNSESTCQTAYGCFIFGSILQTLQQLRPITMSSLKNMCFQSGPVNVETESRNFLALEAELFTDGNKTIITVPIFLPKCIGTSGSLF